MPKTSHVSILWCAPLWALSAAAPTLAAPPEILRDVPNTCTVVSAKELEKSGTSSVLDALKNLPATPAAPGICPKPLKPFDRYILDAHNNERASIGVPPLRWNEVLASHANDYAQVLARIGQLVHSPRESRGAERENLQKGLIGWTPQRMIQDWAKEKVNFVPGTFPNVARDGNWMNVAHYTQMIWPTTTEVGCGQAQGHGFNWFVCRYTPGGNKDGKPVGLPVADRSVATDRYSMVLEADQGGKVIGGEWLGDSRRSVRSNPAYHRWVDARTGRPVPTVIVMPGKGEISFGESENSHLVIPDAGNPERAFDPVTGRNFARAPEGGWIDAKTGEPVPSVIVMPGKGEINFGTSESSHLVIPDAGDPSRAYDPVTKRNFAKAPVP